MAAGSARLERGILRDINSRISDTPVSVPETPLPQRDRYLPVIEEGTIEDEYVRVLASRKHIGAGYRIISPFVTEGRRVLLDRGFIKVDDPLPALSDGISQVKGNLHWPKDADEFTPEPDLKNNLWFARDVPALAQHFGTDPILIIASTSAPAPNAPLPVLYSKRSSSICHHMVFIGCSLDIYERCIFMAHKTQSKR